MAPTLIDTRLGELLQNDGTLTEQDIKVILAAQRDCGERFGEVASRLGLASERDVRRALARQIEFPVLKPGDSDLSPEVVTAYQPYSKRAEELRTLRSDLMLRWFGRSNRVLAVIEPRPGNGCSALAANLAVTFAQLGERTLLIDANLRAPLQHLLFGIEPQYGLVDCIKGEDLENALSMVPGIGCLSVLCAGEPPPNPQELLGRVSFGYLMETAPVKYDVVIVDTPPIRECADAQLIAARARGAILAIKRHSVRLDDVLRAKAQLESAEVSLLGAVIDG
ncbi:MAG: chain length determinant protein tyrosine kinase EpsG [Steroidobacteraceae bacterium]